MGVGGAYTLDQNGVGVAMLAASVEARRRRAGVGEPRPCERVVVSWG